MDKLTYSGGGYGAPVTLASGLAQPLGLTVDQSGNVYVADTDNNAVKKIPYSNGTYGALVTLPVSLPSPVGVAVDGSGNVYVSFPYSSQLQEIPYNGSRLHARQQLNLPAPNLHFVPARQAGSSG